MDFNKLPAKKEGNNFYQGSLWMVKLIYKLFKSQEMKVIFIKSLYYNSLHHMTIK